MHGVGADDELLSDLSVTEALGDQTEYLSLTGAERVKRVGIRAVRRRWR